MIKYVNYEITFREVPDEVSLCINISNCPCHCKGCHSSYLSKDVGYELSTLKLAELMHENPGITCIALMGGDNDPAEINRLADYIYENGDGIKVAWYSGRDELSAAIDLHHFDYVKLGHYDEEYGPLDNPNTNQKFFVVDWDGDYDNEVELIDITYKFWR